MSNLFAVLFFISFIALIVGLANPRLVVRWGSFEKRNRKNVLKYYGLGLLAFFILFGVTLPEEAETNNNAISQSETTSSNENNSIVEKTEVVEEAPKVELFDSDKELFKGTYNTFSEEQMTQFSEIQNKYEKLDENVKQEFKPDFDRLVAEKEAFEQAKAEEEAKVAEQKAAEEKARKEEEARIKAEQKAAEAEAKRLAEAQKYETGLTWSDLARDANGKMGSYVKFYGKVVQVMNGSDANQYRLAVNDDYDQMILIEIDKSKLENNILDDDYITIEGMSMGNISYETVMGAEMTIPGILVDNVYY